MNNDLKSNCYIILPNFEIRHYTIIIAYYKAPENSGAFFIPINQLITLKKSFSQFLAQLLNRTNQRTYFITLKNKNYERDYYISNICTWFKWICTATSIGKTTRSPSGLPKHYYKQQIWKFRFQQIGINPTSEAFNNRFIKRQTKRKVVYFEKIQKPSIKTDPIRPYI